MLRPYLELAKKSFQNNKIYRVNVLFGILNTIISIFVYVAIWKAVYKGQASLHGIDFKSISTHFVITLGLSSIFLFDDNTIPDKVRSGAIAQDLLKPVSFNALLFSQNIGNICFKIIVNFLPALLFSIFFIGIQPPVSLLALCLFIFSIVLGICIYYLINYIVSVTSFWFYNIFALQQIKNAAIMILSGALLPVSFMPGFLVKIIKTTPFEAIYTIPLAIYNGQITTTGIYLSLAKQLLWLLILFCIGRILWKRGIRKLVIQGG